MTIERELFRKFINESEPKNEVKVFRNSIDFQNIGCGFNVKIGSTEEGKVTIFLDGFSNNTETNAEYTSKDLTVAYNLGAEERKAMNDKVVAVKEEIFQELVTVANELDSKIDQIFKKHNFSRNINESIEDDEETAICAWCKEEFPIYDMKKEVNLGYLCDSCQRAIESRGEELVFESEAPKGGMDDSSSPNYVIFDEEHKKYLCSNLIKMDQFTDNIAKSLIFNRKENADSFLEQVKKCKVKEI